MILNDIKFTVYRKLLATAKSPFRTDEAAKENILILISEIRSRLQK